MGELAPSLRVLVVDDNIDAAQIVADFISLQGYTVMVANDGQEAIMTAETFVPDVVFLDIGMPGMDGYEVASTLRRVSWLPSPRIVALTAWGDAASRARAIASGFDSHLVKPARLATILKEVVSVRSAG